MIIALIHALIALVIVALIIGAVYWLTTLFPLHPMLAKVIYVLLACIFVLILIYLLWPLTGLHI